MALFNLKGEALTNMPHKEQYDNWMQNLGRDDYRGVLDAIHDVLDDARDKSEPVYSARIPGREWEGTPYKPIYIACNKDWNASRLFYGQLCWEAVQSHEADWTVIAEERGDDQQGGKIYFVRR
ncbi:MAG: hypothetical protein V3W31_10360 [Thermodesulfobacteriota bacterium]